MGRQAKRTAVGFLLGALASACSPASETPVPPATTQPPASPPPAVSVLALESPAGERSQTPNLAVAPDGSVLLSWIEAAPKGHKLEFARFSDGVWSSPHTIATGANWFVNFADVPSIAAMRDGTLAAHWLANHTPGTEGAHVHMALSKDQGVTWSAPITPHRDRSVYQHGFVSMFSSADGFLHAIWLDGRNTKGEGHGDMSLMYTTLGADGTLGTELTLDERVCDCCATSAVATATGAVAVYRDRSDKEIRDIAVIRFADGRWSQPERIGPGDGWELLACPVNGPAISSSGEHVAVAWFTGADNKPRVNVVLSHDGGKTFGEPIRVDDGAAVGRVDIASLADGGALVSWIQRTNEGPAIHLRGVSAHGTPGAPVIVANVTVASGVAPKMRASGNAAVIAWTDAGKPSRVRTGLVQY